MRLGSIEVSVSILGADFGHLADEINRLVSAGVDRFHLDIMDGHFVPNLTFGPYIAKIVRRYTRLPIDLHLMVSNPEEVIDKLVDFNTVDTILFHIEASDYPIRLIRAIRDRGVKAGLAISPKTPPNFLRYLENELDVLLVMSVEPGFAGQPFITSTYRKLRDIVNIIRGWTVKPRLMVDGGVNSENAVTLYTLGVEIFVCASYILKAKDPRGAVMKLKSIIKY